MLQTLLLLAMTTLTVAQTAPVAVPISKEGHHHLVLENEYVRVYSVEVPPHSETLVHQHDLDYVFVTLGDSDVENIRVGEKPVSLQLKDGEVRFTKGGFAHKAVNNSDQPFRNVTIELKKERDSILPHGEGGGCWGLFCDFAVFTSRHTRCRQYSSAGSGTGVGIPTDGVRLLIAASGIREGKNSDAMREGDAKWIVGPLSIHGEVGKRWATVCEFARDGEDFLEKKNSPR